MLGLSGLCSPLCVVGANKVCNGIYQINFNFIIHMLSLNGFCNFGLCWICYWYVTTEHRSYFKKHRCIYRYVSSIH